MKYDFLQSLQILALDAVVRPDWEAAYRRICRWYSKNFCTPLHLVFTLPPDAVIQNYYEGLYEELEDEELAKVAPLVVETEAEKRKRMVTEVVKLKSEAVDVTKSLERARKAMEATVKAVDTLGRLRSRPNAKTLADIKTAEEAQDGIGAELTKMLAAVPPAPPPRQPEVLAPDPDHIEFTLGGEIPEDFDALGGNLPRKDPKKTRGL